MAEDLFVAIPEAVTKDETATGIQPQGEPQAEPLATAERLTVKFKDHRDPAFVDTHGPWWRETRNLLESLAKINHPASLKLSRDRFITEARMPSVGRVLGMTDAPEGDVAVRLDTFASVLRTERTSAFVGLLDESRKTGKLVAVTSAVADTRIASVVSAQQASGPCVLPGTQLSPKKIVAGLDPVAHQQLKTFLDGLVQDRCTLPTPAQGCHAFGYPLNYCWMHAHVVCELLRNQQISAAKIWVYPTDQSLGVVLKAATRNLPKCHAEWGFHVATLVKSDNQGLRIIDPMLFPCATVSIKAWRTAMGVPTIIRITDTTVYKQPNADNLTGFCPDEFKANLDGSVSDLIATLSSVDGPPPYQSCTVDPCGPPVP